MKLSVLGVAFAALGVSTSTASASDVWLWACHGPSGSAINSFGSHNLAGYGNGCSGAGSTLDDGGLRGLFTPVGGLVYGTDSAVLRVPSETKLTGLRVQRRVSGIATGMEYSLKAPSNAVTLESSTGDPVPAADKTFAVDPGSTVSGTVAIALGCPAAAGCAADGPATLDVSRIGMKVSDTQAPTFAVGGTRSPAAGTLDLDVHGNDAGVGLRYAEAGIEGTSLASKAFPATNCDDLSPDGATVDLPLDNDCAHVDKVDLHVSTTGLPDGDYTLLVRVTDWAGNVTEQRSPVEIANNVNLGTNTQTLSIGTSGAPTPNANANANANNNNGGILGASSQNCKTPRLSFSLSQKPLRVSKGVPVLQYGKRYRFNGRLTCVINGKRQSAPKRARIDVLNKIGKKTYSKAGTTVRDAGKLTIILAYKSSRTITFRFTNSDGKRSSVSIKVKVEKKKSSKR
ncbi:hypothetical protein OM076_22575 [Solirubrobacter ginsenosidimutans]|uniref:Ig-like domain-containing protein n=1 Tax=Solirubrobacter ginsenosidimutans TaxID=490573 RepID=A0A9X3MWQ7_9ACTN|nr:hypothetical protein [Solirubrobacter ginsenosidimutans]MDA0163076.1 hypothetical protein [Solirubrobacter ginsenosidimutans]